MATVRFIVSMSKLNVCVYVMLLAEFTRTLSLLFFSRPSFRSGLLSVHYMVPFSPFPFMLLFVLVFYHETA